MDNQTHRDLELLSAVAADAEVTQRTLAARLDIALGLANLYLKRLARKGYIKLVNVRRNRVRYLITPKGVAEKTRLTYEFMDYSLRLYARARQQLRAALRPCVRGGPKRIAIYGTGEAAELAYLSLREFNLEPAAILDNDGAAQFLGFPVQALGTADLAQYDLVIVATLDRPGPLIARLVSRGIPREKVVTVRE